MVRSNLDNYSNRMCVFFLACDGFFLTCDGFFSEEIFLHTSVNKVVRRKKSYSLENGLQQVSKDKKYEENTFW